MTKEHDALSPLLEFFKRSKDSTGRVGARVGPPYPSHIIELFVLLTVQWKEDLLKGQRLIKSYDCIFLHGLQSESSQMMDV